MFCTSRVEATLYQLCRMAFDRFEHSLAPQRARMLALLAVLALCECAARAARRAACGEHFPAPPQPARTLALLVVLTLLARAARAARAVVYRSRCQSRYALFARFALFSLCSVSLRRFVLLSTVLSEFIFG